MLHFRHFFLALYRNFLVLKGMKNRKESLELNPTYYFWSSFELCVYVIERAFN